MQQFMNSILFQRNISLFSICLLLIFSCVTQKKRDDTSGLSKLYHNTTAKYNGYFNADEIYTISMAKINTDLVENYTKILPIYPEMTSSRIGSVTADLDKGIEKLSVVINLHRTSKWTDDAYLLMGKSQFLKKDYENAVETFAYLVDEFDPSNTRSNNRKITSSSKSKKSKPGRPGQVSTTPAKTSAPKKSAKEIAKERKTKIEDRERIAKERAKAIKEKQKAAKKGKTAPRTTPSKTASPGATTSNPSSSTQNKTTTPVTKSAPPPPVTLPVTKSEPETTNNNLFSHQPAFYAGLVWLSRTYLVQGNYYGALAALDDLKKKSGYTEEVLKDAFKAEAHAHLTQNDYAKAIPALQKTIELSSDPREQARLSFILGQINEQAEQVTQALQAYSDVLSYKAEYEMDFNAKMKKLLLAYKTGQQTEKATMSGLEVLARDQKNKEYRDQLYYAIGDIYLKQSRRPEAKENFILAAQQEVNIPERKSEPFYALAKMYFEESDYIHAYQYFDSTRNVMPRTDIRYAEVQKYCTNLRDIADEIANIQLTDSLIGISLLPEAERRKLAQKIKKEQDEKKAQLLATVNNNANNNPATINPPPGAIAGKTTFFAYDESALKKGLRNFNDKWGNRVLEDHWRRSQRSDAGVATASIDVEEVEAETSLADDELLKILVNVPRNAQELEQAKGKVEESMFKLGILFRQKLDYYSKSIESFEKLLARYPDTRHKPEVYYYLYLNNLDLGRNAQAQVFYDRILNEYKDSKYAVSLINPTVSESGDEDQDKKLAAYYAATFEAYNQGMFQEVVNRITQVEGMFGKNNKLQAKFALLNALSSGNLQGKEGFISALKDFVANYPNTPETTHAKELLRILYGGAASEENRSAPSAIQFFEYEPNVLHYLIVIFYNSSEAPVTPAKTSIYNFSKKYFKQANFNYSQTAVDVANNVPVVLIRDFQSAKDALNYFDTVKKIPNEFLPANYKYDLFVISARNWRGLLQTRNVETYREFFGQNYQRN